MSTLLYVNIRISDPNEYELQAPKYRMDKTDKLPYVPEVYHDDGRQDQSSHHTVWTHPVIKAINHQSIDFWLPY